MPDASPLWIKICGVRDVETAVAAAQLGADAIGINFYPGSPRCVADVATARAIVDALPNSTQAVGVFVNHSAEETRRICDATGLTTVQIHGDEPDELIGELAEFRVIQALRVAGGMADIAAARLSSYSQLQVMPSAWLVDARVEGSYGGTGHRLDWQRLAAELRDKSWPPLILAGGLTPENVAEAASLVQPWGIDVASGVESAPGVKDVTLVERFVHSCRG